jgi:lysophospholipid acyltransferase (LPLAT)-like uncharacterized protein
VHYSELLLAQEWEKQLVLV